MQGLVWSEPELMHVCIICMDINLVERWRLCKRKLCVFAALSLWLALSTVSLASRWSMLNSKSSLNWYSPLLTWPFTIYQSSILVGIYHS